VFKLRFAVAAVAVLGALAGGGTLAAQAGNSSGGQLVFSDTGTGGPFGYWIWCQSTNTNAYGVDCAGSVYFYELNKASISVEGTVTGSGSGGYTITVWNKRGSFAVNCTLTNVPPPTRGPTNQVTETCTNPDITYTADDAVVSGSGTFKS
jgi:hypothetical protein